MNQDLKITLVQTSLHWEDKQKNFMHFDSLLNNSEETDLIILPEMFTTGFSMRTRELGETMEGKTVEWMQKTAQEKRAVLTGSIIVKESGKYFNRLVWMMPDGTFEYYDKRHLFRMGKEHEHYSSGNKKIFPMIKDWRICSLVCYDLRFPVWSRNTEPYYDLLIYVANWPEVRSNAWKILLQARAMENHCYVAGVNRIGEDGRGIDHSGDSLAADPRGTILSSIQPHEEKTETINLSAEHLKKFRESFPVFMDADKFLIRED